MYSPALATKPQAANGNFTSPSGRWHTGESLYDFAINPARSKSTMTKTKAQQIMAATEVRAADDVTAAIQDIAAEFEPYIIKQRRHFHKHPELSLAEERTTSDIANQLDAMNIPYERPLKTGLVATLRGTAPDAYREDGTPRRRILLRADIDALPIQEENDCGFCSQNDGVMHACGHDCHTAMLLGAAKLLSEHKDELRGTVKLLFQAAEECFVGSHYYWDNGYLGGIDAAMGMHVWPTVESGRMAIMDGYLMASCDNFRITVRGRGAHSMTPQLGRDAVAAAAAVIREVQTIAARMNKPDSPLVISIGTVESERVDGRICERASMEGTFRAFDIRSQRLALEMIEHIADSAAAIYGCTAEFEHTFSGYAVNNRDTALNALARDAARKLFGEDVLQTTAKAMGSEDFAYIMERIPSSLFVFLGCRDEKAGCTHPVHNEKFRINEDILHIGAAEYAQFVFDYLEQTANGTFISAVGEHEYVPVMRMDKPHKDAELLLPFDGDTQSGLPRYRGRFTMEIAGKAAHGSAPQDGHDAALAAADVIAALGYIVSRQNDPLDALTITVNGFNAGAKLNILAGNAVLNGEYGCNSEELFADAMQCIKTSATNAAAVNGCSISAVFGEAEHE